MKRILIAATVTVCVGIVATAAAALAATTAISASPVRAASVARTATPKSASACSKVSAASVAAIVGHAAPCIADFSNTRFPATKQSGGVSGVATQCSYGNGPTIVVLFDAVTSKPLSISTLESATKASAPASEKVTITSYSGLGVPGFRVTVGSGAVYSNELVGLSGKTEFRATALNSLSLSKLAALAKLARKL